MATVSIKDIAKELGVSTTTVSFVLNGKAKEKRISNALQDRIIQTARRHNYRPNQVARGLRTGRSNTLGLIVEDISNPFFAQLARYVEHEADMAGYTVMFCSTENDDEKGVNLLYMLRHRQIDGFIIIPTPGMRKEVESLIREEKPVVLVDRYFPELDTCHVTIDNYMGAYQATSLLLQKGFQRIGLVTIDSAQVQMAEREKGYHKALRDAGTPGSEDTVLRIPYDMSDEETVRSIVGLIEAGSGLDALFFTTNYLGVAGLEAIRITGRRVPGEMGIICFDDSILFRLGSPSVSVVAQPIREIGEQAVRMIIEMISKKTVRQRQLTLSPVLIQRDSI
jgi:LacI family transcriptional regulator